MKHAKRRRIFTPGENPPNLFTFHFLRNAGGCYPPLRTATVNYRLRGILRTATVSHRLWEPLRTATVSPPFVGEAISLPKECKMEDDCHQCGRMRSAPNGKQYKIGAPFLNLRTASQYHKTRR